MPRTKARLLVRGGQPAREGKGSTFTVRLPAEGSPRSLKTGEKVSVDIKAGQEDWINILSGMLKAGLNHSP